MSDMNSTVKLGVEFMSLIFYQTLFTQFDGGVHVAHLLPDSVHPD
jgi:hypothetical protein